MAIATKQRYSSPHVGCPRSEEHTSELQSLRHLVCRLLLEKKNPTHTQPSTSLCPIPLAHDYRLPIRLLSLPLRVAFFFFNDTATTEIYTLSLHDALPIRLPGRAARRRNRPPPCRPGAAGTDACARRSEEHTSELQSLRHLVCRLLLEKKKKKTIHQNYRKKKKQKKKKKK